MDREESETDKEGLKSQQMREMQGLKLFKKRSVAIYTHATQFLWEG